MIQQINLYHDSGTDDRHSLVNPYLLTMIAAFLFLLIISSLSIFKLHSHQADLQGLQAQLRQAQAQVATLRSQHPNPQADLTLLQELQQTQTLQQSLSEILELLTDNQSDRTLGFSRYLSALAVQSDGNVWLTGIHINSATDSISLQGSTFKAEQIPLLLQRLQNTDAFRDRHFARLGIQQSKQFPEQVDFSVSSSLESEKGAPNVDKP